MRAFSPGHLAAALVLALALAACGGGRVRLGMDVQHLTVFLQSPDHFERARAAEFLGSARDAAAVPHLVEALKTERYAHVIASESIALATIGAPEAGPVIQSYLAHPNRKVVRIAVRAQRTYELYRPYHGQALPLRHGRPVLPTGQVAPPEEPAAAPPAEEQVAPQ